MHDAPGEIKRVELQSWRGLQVLITEFKYIEITRLYYILFKHIKNTELLTFTYLIHTLKQITCETDISSLNIQEN